MAGWLVGWRAGWLPSTSWRLANQLTSYVIIQLRSWLLPGYWTNQRIKVKTCFSKLDWNEGRRSCGNAEALQAKLKLSSISSNGYPATARRWSFCYSSLSSAKQVQFEPNWSRLQHGPTMEGVQRAMLASENVPHWERIHYAKTQNINRCDS